MEGKVRCNVSLSRVILYAGKGGRQWVGWGSGRVLWTTCSRASGSPWPFARWGGRGTNLLILMVLISLCGESCVHFDGGIVGRMGYCHYWRSDITKQSKFYEEGKVLLSMYVCIEVILSYPREQG